MSGFTGELYRLVNDALRANYQNPAYVFENLAEQLIAASIAAKLPREAFFETLEKHYDGVAPLFRAALAADDEPEPSPNGKVGLA
jgi:hypothetical protein